MFVNMLCVYDYIKYNLSIRAQQRSSRAAVSRESGVAARESSSAEQWQPQRTAAALWGAAADAAADAAAASPSAFMLSSATLIR